MNIENLSDREKSVILAKLCGWSCIEAIYGVEVIDATGLVVTSNFGTKDTGWMDDLYHPGRMQLAWRVLNWWVNTKFETGLDYPVYTLFKWNHLPFVIGLPPAEAQRLWLDKILQLAIEAGMVEEAGE